MHIEEIAAQIVDSAFKVHKHLGPGLLESAYQKCLVHELKKRGLLVQCEVQLPIVYDGEEIDAGYRIDMVVEGCIIIENKTVQKLEPVHTAQILTYLKLSGLTLGFLINWHEALLRDGLHRVVRSHATDPLPCSSFASSRLRG